jgi:hypothetical protein
VCLQNKKQKNGEEKQRKNFRVLIYISISRNLGVQTLWQSGNEGKLFLRVQFLLTDLISLSLFLFSDKDLILLPFVHSTSKVDLV